MKDAEFPMFHPLMMRNACSFLGVTAKAMFYLTILTTISCLIYLTCSVYSFHSETNSSSAVNAVHRIDLGGSGDQTRLGHIVFGIAASSKKWERRKNYIKLWWEPGKMRGFVWLDKPMKMNKTDLHSLPPLKVSGNTTGFRYTYRRGHRSALRLTRIVSETLRLGVEDVRWIVMGDDDTFFVAENLVRVLSKYDHTQFYYIGANSESHLQNLKFSYNMAFGGGGFAISIPLAKALEKFQDKCIERYPELYGSDDRIQACTSELGVPLTREAGFHQFDLYGNVYGILAAHPVAPLVSLHHLDVIMPILPNLNQFKALQLLTQPMKLDSAALAQQSICYHRANNWTVSVSWGYAVQITRGVVLPRVMQVPTRTFIDWNKRGYDAAFSFSTRTFIKNACQMPAVYTFSSGVFDSVTNQTVTRYGQYSSHRCEWKMPDPVQIRHVEVHKKPNALMWNKSPRRNCCRVLPSSKQDTVLVEVAECREGEVISIR